MRVGVEADVSPHSHTWFLTLHFLFDMVSESLGIGDKKVLIGS